MAAGIIAPESETEVQAAVADACAEGRPLVVEGAGTKRGLGRPVHAETCLSLARLSGITYYEPGELVMEARAGTSLTEIEATLADNGQQLAFEAPDFGPLFGGDAGRGTAGGVFACNLSGPRRPFAGAARDHLLGVRAVSGRGELFAAGGRVVKNVTGYDMGKLLAGSFGTLAVLSRVTFKVVPRAEAQRTVLLPGKAPREGLATLAAVAGEPWEISAAVHLSRMAAARSRVSYVANAGGPVTALRLEGARGAVEERAAALRGRLADFGPTEELHTHNSRAFWREVRDGALLPGSGDDGMLWRLSLPPAEAGGTLEWLEASGGAPVFDWLGGLIWLWSSSSDRADAQVRTLREAATRSGGHATLWRAPDAVRESVEVFTPPGGALGVLTRRIKQNFDPRGILNPRRMYEDL